MTTVGGLAPASAGATDGTGSAARFAFPFGIAVDNVGNLYIGDEDNNAIRKGVAGGVPTTLLTVSKSGTGAGTVSSTPAGIHCGADCTETLAFGTAVTLTADASTGSVFTGWSGGGCSGLRRACPNSRRPRRQCAASRLHAPVRHATRRVAAGKRYA